jgi:hypothetical protein
MYWMGAIAIRQRTSKTHCILDQTGKLTMAVPALKPQEHEERKPPSLY